MTEKKQFTKTELYNFGDVCYCFGMAEGSRRAILFLEKIKGRCNNGRKDIKRTDRKASRHNRKAAAGRNRKKGKEVQASKKSKAKQKKA